MKGRKHIAATLLVIFVVGGLAAPWFHRLHHAVEARREAQARVPVAFVHPEADVSTVTRAHLPPLVQVNCPLCAPQVYEPGVLPVAHVRLPRRSTLKALPSRVLSHLERPRTCGRAPPAPV
ncbi:hypothetical protein [Rhodocaloribacter sp.]